MSLHNWVPSEQEQDSKGGTAVKIDFARAGQMEKAQRDTYKRVYDDNGNYTMPQVPENRLREKGKEYFRPMEVTGSNEGDNKHPKFSLTKYFEERLFRKLDDVVRSVEEEENCKVVVRFQWDGAGPHRDNKLVNYLDSEFRTRNWILVPQPSQSPLTNTKDPCIFPSLSKKVTEAQGLQKGSIALEGDEIWKYAKQAFDNLPLETIARSYAAHHQIVNAIYKDKGGDDFTRAKKALHVGSRLHFLPYHGREDSTAATGVFSIESLDTVTSKQLEKAKLKYDTPDVTIYQPEHFLNQHELAVLAEHLPADCDIFPQYSRAVEDFMSTVV